MNRLVILFLCLIVAAPLPVSAEPSAPGSGGSPVEQLRKLRATLTDDAARQSLIADLEALIALEEQGIAEPEQTGGRLGREPVEAIGEAKRGLAAAPPPLDEARTVVPQLLDGVGRVWQDPERRSEAARQFALLAGIFLAGWVAEYGLAGLASPLRRRLMSRAPPTFLERCRYGLLRAAIEFAHPRLLCGGGSIRGDRRVGDLADRCRPDPGDCLRKRPHSPRHRPHAACTGGRGIATPAAVHPCGNGFLPVAATHRSGRRHRRIRSVRGEDRGASGGDGTADFRGCGWLGVGGSHRVPARAPARLAGTAGSPSGGLRRAQRYPPGSARAGADRATRRDRPGRWRCLGRAARSRRWARVRGCRHPGNHGDVGCRNPGASRPRPSASAGAEPRYDGGGGLAVAAPRSLPVGSALDGKGSAAGGVGLRPPPVPGRRRDPMAVKPLRTAIGRQQRRYPPRAGDRRRRLASPQRIDHPPTRPRRRHAILAAGSDPVAALAQGPVHPAGRSSSGWWC